MWRKKTACIFALCALLFLLWKGACCFDGEINFRSDLFVCVGFVRNVFDLFHVCQLWSLGEGLPPSPYPNKHPITPLNTIRCYIRTRPLSGHIPFAWVTLSACVCKCVCVCCEPRLHASTLTIVVLMSGWGWGGVLSPLGDAGEWLLSPRQSCDGEVEGRRGIHPKRMTGSLHQHCCQDR